MFDGILIATPYLAFELIEIIAKGLKLKKNKTGILMSADSLREYLNIKGCTPTELEMVFQIMGLSKPSKNKKVVFLIREGGIDFMLACKILNTKSSTARRTADRVERGLIKMGELFKLRANK